MGEIFMLKKTYLLWLALLSPLAQAETPQTLQFSEATYSVNEDGGSVDLTVTRVGGSDGAISVEYISVDDTATDGEDYIAVSDTLSWDDGDASDKTFNVPIFNDGDFEGDETFNLSLENATGGATIGDPGTVVVTIIDDDQPQPSTLQFSEATYSVNEDGGTVDITVTRVGDSDGAISVSYKSYDGAAVAEEDYSKTKGVLSWGDGDTDDKTFTVPILDDVIFEGYETFKLKLKKPTGGAVIGDPGTAVVTIIDDDQPGTVQFSEAEYSVNEDGGSVELTVSRVDGSDGAIAVGYYSYNYTAVSGEDYIEAEGTLNWDDGDASDKTFTVSILDDVILEGDETFILRLKKATGGATIGYPGTAVVTIIDDDQPGTVQFSEAEYSVNEDGGSVELTVSRVGGSDGAISVRCKSSNGSATAGEDYGAVSYTLFWGDGDASDKTFTVPIFDDVIFEGDETFSLLLKKPTGGATIGVPDSAVVTIIDDDQPGTVQFSEATYSVNEDGGSIAITVTRVGGSDGAISVDYYSYNGTAVAGEDYSKTKGVLSWDDGDTDDKTFTVDILDDAIFEGDETFRLLLRYPEGGATIGDPDTAVVTIIDDVLPGTVQFSEAEYSINEDGGSVAITVSRVGGSDGAISVRCKSSSGSATAGEDYSAVSYTLFWGDGDASDKTFTVPILDDVIFEGDETFSLLLKKPTGGAAIGVPDSAVVTIIDDDQPGTVQFSSATYSVNEDGGSVAITVSRVNGSDGVISVECNSSNGSATAREDYSVVSYTLFWSDGDVSDKTFTVDILDDAIFEGDETFSLLLKYPGGGATIGEPGTAVVTIVDDEMPELGSLRFSRATYSVDEDGGSVVVKVDRVGGIYGAVSVDYATSDDSAIDGDDYIGVSGTLRWSNGDDRKKSFSVDVVDDDVIEDDKTFIVSLGNATGGAEIGDPGTAVVTIVDDETTKPDTNCDDVTEIPKEECEALVALFESTDGANWDDNTGWNMILSEGTDDANYVPCSWYGVFCKEGHVSRLSLYSNNLNGEIPIDLGNLLSLKKLDLSFNRLTGSIPIEFDNLIKLKNLNLSFNQLTGSIPAELSNLRKLRFLKLHSNELCGEIPADLRKLSKIGLPDHRTYLKLDNNHLTASDSKLIAWLNSHNPGWVTQTPCP
jgi:hypothetical protein